MAVFLTVHNLHREEAYTSVASQPLSCLPTTQSPYTPAHFWHQGAQVPQRLGAPRKCQDWTQPREAWQGAVLGSGSSFWESA
jgi:hypothetical protein